MNTHQFVAGFALVTNFARRAHAIEHVLMGQHRGVLGAGVERIGVDGVALAGDPFVAAKMIRVSAGVADEADRIGRDFLTSAST